MSNLSPEAIEFVRDAGLLRNNGIDREKATSRLIEILIADHEAKRVGDIPSKAATMAEYTDPLFGTSQVSRPRELRQYTTPLLRVSPRSPVQHHLPNGYVLCVAEVQREVFGQDPRTYTARFISTNPDVIASQLHDALVKRLLATAEHSRQLIELLLLRQPALAPRLQQIMPTLVGLQEAFALLKQPLAPPSLPPAPRANGRRRTRAA